MASIRLNTFRTKTFVVQPPPAPGDAVPFVSGPDGTGTSYPNPGDNRYKVYQAPLGTTAVVLYAQVANIGANVYDVTLLHYRQNSQPFPYTELVNVIQVPNNDSLVLLAGKLVLETSDSLYVYGSAPLIPPALIMTDLKLTVSVLESANE